MAQDIPYDPTDSGQMDDEAMLEHVRRGMGNEGGPPPGSGMKWEVLEDDQAALVANPSPENVQAFVQYWGEENMPEELTSGGGTTANVGQIGRGGGGGEY